ncbi:conserved hypothetical protein [Ricinus communis]|uniref:Uncharacterized protein n=1 Tax=Ricinus communis TaxID=3988 RepID=B9TJR8_RICCO|nr:conserved hypothetical protein [Ricinus communis]
MSDNVHACRRLQEIVEIHGRADDGRGQPGCANHLFDHGIGDEARFLARCQATGAGELQDNGFQTAGERCGYRIAGLDAHVLPRSDRDLQHGMRDAGAGGAKRGGIAKVAFGKLDAERRECRSAPSVPDKRPDLEAASKRGANDGAALHAGGEIDENRLGLIDSGHQTAPSNRVCRGSIVKWLPRRPETRTRRRDCRGIRAGRGTELLRPRRRAWAYRDQASHFRRKEFRSASRPASMGRLTLAGVVTSCGRQCRACCRCPWLRDFPWQGYRSLPRISARRVPMPERRRHRVPFRSRASPAGGPAG